MNGFLLVNKEKGMTSFDVVFQLRKKLGIKKIGHTGTLDPNTEGLLVIAVGKATKYINLISDKKIKEYVAVAKLGIHTDSYDITGEVLEEKQVKNIADEIVIVDGTSTDATIEIAKKFNSKILVRENPQMFHILILFNC